MMKPVKSFPFKAVTVTISARVIFTEYPGGKTLRGRDHAAVGGHADISLDSVTHPIGLTGLKKPAIMTNAGFRP